MNKKLQFVLWIIIAVVVLAGIGVYGYRFFQAKTETPVYPEATFEIENYGTVKIELYPEYAPNTVTNFIKLIEKPREFESLEHEKAWFIMVTKNYCKDVLKSSWFRKVELGDLPELVQEDEEEQELLVHICSLGKKYREVIYLYYYEEYSVKEISKILQRKESTIQTQLATARKKLRIKLEQEEMLWTRN